MIITSNIGAAPEIPSKNAVASFLESPYLNDPASQDNRIYVDSITDQGYTVGQLRKLVPRAAALLKNEYNIQKNDVVGLFGVNHIFTAIVHFATLSRGAALSPANIMYSAEELSHQVRMTQPRLLVVFDDAKPVAVKACEIAQCSGRIVTFSELFAKFAALLNDSNASEEYPVEVDGKTHTAYLCFSSGTSGLPKGVVTTHYNIIGNVLQQVSSRSPICDPSLPQSGLLPMSHIYGLNCSIWTGPYTSKMTLVFPKFDIELLVKKSVQYKLKVLFLVPPIVLLLGKTDILDKNPEFAKTVRFIISGAAPISRNTIQLVAKKAPEIFIVQGYGLTETTPVVTTGFHWDPAAQGVYDQESIGWLLPGVEARLVDPTTNKDVTGTHQRGEMWVRGPMVMAGYYKNPEATADVFEDGGWFKTGDVAIFDEHGQFHIVDRIKELIKSNGHQVAPAELESTLLTHEGVLDSAVIGVLNKDKTSEMPRAYLVLKQGVDAKDIVKWFNQRVAKHKRLWGGAVVTDVIPKNATGKIMRNLLRQRNDNDKAIGMEFAASSKL